jgi:hypothetical protein
LTHLIRLMGAPLMGGHSKRNGLLGHVRWGWIAAAVMAVPALPAQADELADWNYDLETRSLTLSLPQNVVPAISVVAPDRLLLELPNTQVGETTGQTVDDGLVESITLEQTTPDTVWMIVEFAPGTVLADSQSASPSAADASQPSLQQWQVRPALLASSRSADPVAMAEPAADAAEPTAEPSAEPSAESLRPPAVDLAQAPDFSDLPVLEPAMPINEPVSVPPLDSVEPVQVEADETSQPLAESAPVAEADIEAAPIEVPVINASEPDEPDLDASEQPVASSGEDSEEAALPVEPPFLGEIGRTEAAPDLPSEPPVAVTDLETDLEEALPAIEPVIEADAAEAEPIAVADPQIGSDSTEASVSDADRAESDVVETTASQEIAELPSEPAVVEEAIAPEPPSADIPADIPAEITPANVNRWPDPIPFGQPLP